MARDEEEAKSSAFKVVDRRRFDSGGEERAGVAPVAPPTPPPPPEPAPSTKARDRQAHRGGSGSVC